MGCLPCATLIKHRPVNYTPANKHLLSGLLWDAIVIMLTLSTLEAADCCCIKLFLNSGISCTRDPCRVQCLRHSTTLRSIPSKGAAYSLLGERGQKQGHLVPLHLGILLYSGLHGVLVPLNLCVLFKSALEVIHKFLDTAATPQQGSWPGRQAST